MNSWKIKYKKSPVEVKFDLYMEKLKNSDLPNNEEGRRATKAFWNLEYFSNKKKTIKQVELPNQEDVILRQHQHKYWFDLYDDNYQHIGIIIQKLLMKIRRF